MDQKQLVKQVLDFNEATLDNALQRNDFIATTNKHLVAVENKENTLYILSEE